MHKVFLIFVLVAFFGCSKKPVNDKENIISQSTEQLSSTKINHSLGEILSPEARKIVNEWPEYINIESLLDEYYSITKNKALANADNLSVGAQQLKDSIRIKRFDAPEVKIRLNVFYNNTLTLSELNTLRTVDSDILKKELTNTIEAFSAINSKLNSIVKKEILEQELKQFN